MFVWFAATFILSVRISTRLTVTDPMQIIFGSFALAYYRQLLDPSLIRQRVADPRQTEAFQMQPGYYGAPPSGQQSWVVPPYPGNPGAEPPRQFEKSDYHPEAEWAQVETLMYDPSTGPPPTNPFADGSGSAIASNKAEDEAWERAKSGGVTAHLTGHAPPPRLENPSGYTIPNPEEDEAWDLAKAEGVTAHYTGGGRPSRGRI